jgi:hypothetical protein
MSNSQPTTSVEESKAAEREAIRAYEDTIAGIPDCFDGLAVGVTLDAPEDLDYLQVLPGMLRDWWSALDTLDGEIGGDGMYDLPASPASRSYLHYEYMHWFAARQDLLHAIAHRHGLSVPRPDHKGSGEIETSSHPRGFFGFHDSGLVR